jgi:hypothetical protein
MHNMQVVRGDIEGAFHLGQKQLRPLRSQDNLKLPEKSLLQQVPALLAYEKPHESSLAFLVGSEHRCFVAEVVNSSMLLCSREDTTKRTVDGGTNHPMANIRCDLLTTCRHDSNGECPALCRVKCRTAST